MINLPEKIRSGLCLAALGLGLAAPLAAQGISTGPVGGGGAIAPAPQPGPAVPPPAPQPVVPAPGPAVPPPPPAPVTPPAVPGQVAPPPIPQPPPPARLAYFVVINGQQQGPFDEAGLRAKIASGELVRNSLVWTAGMQNWEEAAKVPDLVPILAAVPPKPQFDAMAYLAGVWVADPQIIQIPNVGQGRLNLRTQYRRDGTYSTIGSIDMVMQGYPSRQTITSEGTYTAKEQGKNKLLITPNGMTTFSMPGTTSQTSPDTTPFVITVIDQNTATNDSGGRSVRISN